VHRPVLRDVVEEHLEEIAFLSIQRRRMLFSPDIGPRGVDGLDARLEAHHDAMRIAGPEGLAIAAERLNEHDAWHRYAAARIWLEDGRPPTASVLDRIDEREDEPARAWREALRRSPGEVARGLAAAGPATDAALALIADACAWHGVPLPAPADTLARSDVSEVRAAAARGLGAAERSLIEHLIGDAEPAVARSALWSLALCDRERALALCRERLDRGEAEPFAIQTLGLIGDRDDLPRVLPAVAHENVRDAAIRALGHLGAIETVPLLLGLIGSADREAAMAATDALEAITGPLAPPPRRRLPRPADAEPAPPPAEWAAAEWRRMAPRFEQNGRYQRGWAFPDPPAGDPPMSFHWRRAVQGFDPATVGLRREVPDGFFDAAPTHEARPGE
jgi:HEAT repeat protein